MPKQFCPSPRELDDLELLTTGALAPLTAFNQPGSPVTLTLPDDLAGDAAVELVDPEGLPLALVSNGGEVTPLTHAQHGPFRRLYLSPAQAREQHGGATWVPVTDALTVAQIDELRATGGRVVLLALVGAGTPDLSAVALIRASLLAAQSLDDAVVVAVPLASHGDAAADHELGLRVVDNFAQGDPVHALIQVEDGAYPDDLAEIVERDRPAPAEQGLVLFFTGLSGSGKSTLARALMDRILEQTERTVTTLDGDVVRRHLSAGLTFSKADRETNIRRIGWVAAEISRHRGIAVCSPIAPFAETRAQVREMVEDAGGAFFLVHVATPLEECERRDRKGLYAKARAGEIPEFTGISSPYEEPDDAAVRVDTTGRTIEDALDDVVAALRESGHLDLTTAGTERRAPLRVLFVCTANICRSPYMQLWASARFGPESGLVFSSAGTHAQDGHPMDPTMADASPELGMASSGFRSRRLTPSMINEADLVLTAEGRHRELILAEKPEAFRKVFSLGQAARSLAQETLRGTGHQLIAELVEHRSRTRAEDDVPDPIGRGPEMAAAVARLLQDQLDHVLSRISR